MIDDDSSAMPVPIDTGRGKVQPIHKGIDEPYRVVGADIVVNRLRQ
jgi:hypothetical protein